MTPTVESAKIAEGLNSLDTDILDSTLIDKSLDVYSEFDYSQPESSQSIEPESTEPESSQAIEPESIEPTITSVPNTKPSSPLYSSPKIVKKRANNFPIDDLVSSSSQPIKLAATRMSSEKCKDDPMVTSFVYKIRKIKDAKSRRLLELQIDRVINDSLYSYYEQFGYDE